MAPMLERRPGSKNSQPVWFFKRSNLRSSEAAVAAVVTPRKNKSCMIGLVGLSCATKSKGNPDNKRRLPWNACVVCQAFAGKKVVQRPICR
jgi:hypothetical protein